MEDSKKQIEIKPIDKWNSRVMTVIVIGYVYYHIMEAAALHVMTKEPDAPADLKWAFWGAICAAGLITLALALSTSTKIFYPVMALQREMINEVWELLKKAWRMR